MPVGSDNWCRHQFNASELYRTPGLGTHCGAETFQGFEDYEDVDNSGGSPQIVTKTRLRETFDPFCPAHGGTTDPRGTAPKEAVSTSEGDSTAASKETEGVSSKWAPTKSSDTQKVSE